MHILANAGLISVGGSPFQCGFYPGENAEEEGARSIVVVDVGNISPVT